MKWTDTREIAIALTQKLPDIDPNLIRPAQLRVWVLELNQFTDVPDLCDEKMLQDIQQTWIEEFEKK
jgi:FeS assembly protein IscX